MISPQLRTGLLLLTFAFFSTALSGCYRDYRVKARLTPQVDPWVPKSKVATICVLRHEESDEEQRFYHYDNGKLVGISEGAGVYFCYLAEPGIHRLLAAADYKLLLALRTQAGRHYYTQLIEKNGTQQLTMLSAHNARKILPHLYYSYTFADDKELPRIHRMPVPPSSRFANISKEAIIP